MNRSLDTFESTLLTGLREHVQTRTPRRSPRRRLVGGVCAVAGGVTAVLVVPGMGVSAAYSVSEGNTGEVTVKVRRLEDASGLEAALADKGIRAEVSYLPDGQQCTRDVTSIDRPDGGIGTSTSSDHSFEIRLAPGTIRRGETLVLDASVRDLPPEPRPDSAGVRDLGGIQVWLSAEVVQGDPGPCRPA